MVLLYLLHRLDIDCTVAHCNYRLRGDESDADMRLVEEVASMWGFECITAQFDSTQSNVSNTQIWARDLRYTMFRDLKRELEADYIITAHHQDDQVETILLKVLRGAGPGAWSGMSVVEGDLFRPLLNVEREQIVEFAKNQHVPFRDDATNELSVYARNFIRNDLAVQLDSLIPGWKQNVLSITKKADQYRAMTSTLLDQVQIGESELDREKLLVLPEDVLLPVIHLFIEQSGNAAVTSGELGQVRNIKNLQTGSRLRFSNDFELIRDRDTLRLNRLFNRTGLSNPEKVDESDLPHKFMVGEIEAYLRVEPWTGEIRAGELQLDYSKVEWPLMLRAWRSGDKIQPLGMRGHKLVSDLLTDAKISTVQKKEAFLAESFDGIICAVIFPHNKSNMEIGVISDQFRCTNTTEQILRIDTDSEPDGSISS